MYVASRDMRLRLLYDSDTLASGYQALVSSLIPSASGYGSSGQCVFVGQRPCGYQTLVPGLIPSASGYWVSSRIFFLVSMSDVLSHNHMSGTVRARRSFATRFRSPLAVVGSLMKPFFVDRTGPFSRDPRVGLY